MIVAYYVQRSLGLGHVFRAHKFLTLISERRPNWQIIAITDSPFLFYLSKNDKYTTFSLSNLYSNLANKPSEELSDILKYWLLDLLNVDVFLISHWRCMAGELSGLIPILKRSNVKIGMVLRDIIGQPRLEPELVSSFKDGLLNILDNMIDGVAVLGDDSVHSMADEFSVLKEYKRLFYCGYMPPVASLNETETATNKPSDLFCFVGGGWDGDHVLRTAMSLSVSLANKLTSFNSSIITGPFCKAGTQLNLYKERNQSRGVVLSAYESNWRNAVSSNSIIVCMGGYNTLTEVLYYGAKAICIPRNMVGLDEEQYIRSRKFESISNITTIEQSELTHDLLEDIYYQKSDISPDLPPLHLFDNGEKCVSYIEWLIENGS